MEPNTPPESIAEPVPEQPLKSKPKFPKWIIPAVVILFLLVVGGVSAFILSKNSSLKTKTIQKEVVKPTPTPTPTVTPTTSTTPIIPVTTNNTSPTPTPAVTTGNISVTFAQWIDGVGANSQTTPNGATSFVHIGGNGIDRTSQGSPNWSSSFSPGTYDVNGSSSSLGAFMFQRCEGDGCAEDSNGNVQNCGFKVNLKAGSSINLTCWYKK